MRDHCYYCDKPLYTMQLNQRTGAVTSVVIEKAHNSDNEPICLTCHPRLIYRGSIIECSHCDKPIYTIRHDKFKEDPLTVQDLKGIAPQHDPIGDVINRCTHCKNIIEWG
jgi:hypothetical protein